MKIEYLIDKIMKNLFNEKSNNPGELLKKREELLKKPFSSFDSEIKKIAKTNKSEVESIMKKSFIDLNINERLIYINELITNNVNLEISGKKGRELELGNLINLNLAPAATFQKDYEILNKKVISKQLKEQEKLFDFDIRMGELSTPHIDFKKEFKSYMKEVLSNFFRKYGCLPGEESKRIKSGTKVDIEDKDFEKLNDLITKKTKKMEKAYSEVYNFLKELNDSIYKGKTDDFFYNINATTTLGIFLDTKSDFYKKISYSEGVYDLLIDFSKKLLNFDKKLFIIKTEQENKEKMNLDYTADKTSFDVANFFEFNSKKISEKDFLDLKMPDFDKLNSDKNALIYFMSVMHRINDIGNYPSP
ncbi:MAG: hypothetical protein PHN56_02850 [Candidatus Nanoarchaeia archaeon]|nr:hypothetical protein [Candidatus Nanoarchaeia archaeon]